MKVTLLGREAEVEFISAQQQQSLVSGSMLETIRVFFNFDEENQVASTIGFGVTIEAKEYTKEEFIQAITTAGEIALGDISYEDIKCKELKIKNDKQKEEVNRMVTNMGEQFEIPFYLIGH